VDLVIDTNCLNSPRLRTFLGESATNRAVLTHETAVESFRGDIPDGIIQSWSVLRDFPNQTVMLKGPRLIAPLDCTSPGMVRAMICKGQTSGAKKFAGFLDEAAAGNPAIIAQLKIRYGWSAEHADRMVAEFVPASDQIADMVREFTPDEMRRIRKLQDFSDETAEKIFRIVDSIAATTIYHGPIKIKPPKHRHRVNHFIWRRALVHVSYLLSLIERGATQRADNKVRNDSMDAMLATYATYFGGIMTGDQLAETLHIEARNVLVALGARVPRDRVLETPGAPLRPNDNAQTC